MNRTAVRPKARGGPQIDFSVPARGSRFGYGGPDADAVRPAASCEPERFSVSVGGRGRKGKNPGHHCPGFDLLAQIALVTLPERMHRVQT